MSKLKYLDKSDMRDFTNLRYLYLYNNVLEFLQSDVFRHNTQLEYISFYANRLMHIGSKVLNDLPRLRTAYFNKNICIDKQAVSSEKEISELRLEIAERCSDITMEDLMSLLSTNNAKISKMESKIIEMSEQLKSFIEIVKQLKPNNSN